MADTTMLFTTVKNALGTTRAFGYLGPHGRTLPGYAHFSQVGNLIDAIAPNNISKTYRKTNAIQADLLAGRIVLIRTPAVILKDAISGAIKALNLSGGTLGVVDPSYGSYTD